MADIWYVLRGQPDLQAMSVMSIAELMDWHDLAVERVPKEKG